LLLPEPGLLQAVNAIDATTMAAAPITFRIGSPSWVWFGATVSTVAAEER
jgi:hypothetical protein